MNAILLCQTLLAWLHEHEEYGWLTKAERCVTKLLHTQVFHLQLSVHTRIAHMLCHYAACWWRQFYQALQTTCGYKKNRRIIYVSAMFMLITWPTANHVPRKWSCDHTLYHTLLDNAYVFVTVYVVHNLYLCGKKIDCTTITWVAICINLDGCVLWSLHQGRQENICHVKIYRSMLAS